MTVLRADREPVGEAALAAPISLDLYLKLMEVFDAAGSPLEAARIALEVSENA